MKLFDLFKKKKKVEPKCAYISASHRELINNTPDLDCVKWWHEFNTWGWPSVFTPVETAPKNNEEYNNGTGRRRAYMDAIEKKVGMCYILYVLNTSREDDPMTDREFLDFWNGTHCGDKEAEKRYWGRLKTKNGIPE